MNFLKCFELLLISTFLIVPFVDMDVMFLD
jgi:hypothetical protein